MGQGALGGGGNLGTVRSWANPRWQAGSTGLEKACHPQTSNPMLVSWALPPAHTTWHIEWDRNTTSFTQLPVLRAAIKIMQFSGILIMITMITEPKQLQLLNYQLLQSRRRNHSEKACLQCTPHPASAPLQAPPTDRGTEYLWLGRQQRGLPLCPPRHQRVGGWLGGLQRSRSSAGRWCVHWGIWLLSLRGHVEWHLRLHHLWLRELRGRWQRHGREA